MQATMLHQIQFDTGALFFIFFEIHLPLNRMAVYEILPRSLRLPFHGRPGPVHHCISPGRHLIHDFLRQAAQSYSVPGAENNIYIWDRPVVQSVFLVDVLRGVISQDVRVLLTDVVLLAISNILLFSIWYWVIDPPGVDGRVRNDEPWDFLFPQRAQALPQYESWVPRYTDYIFLAFTTSFTFNPTDTLPLTRRAKMLMLLQSTISLITLTGIASSAINILVGGN
jgi:hypothetical protein